MGENVRTKEDIDADLSARVERRKELRAERERIKLERFTDPTNHTKKLRVNQQRIDAQSEMIARLIDERVEAEMAGVHIPNDLSDLAY